MLIRNVEQVHAKSCSHKSCVAMQKTITNVARYVEIHLQGKKFVTMIHISAGGFLPIPTMDVMLYG